MLQFSWDPPEGSVGGRKFEPLTINVNCALFAGALAGLMAVRPGKGFGGGLMMKAMGLDRPLFPAPEAGLRVLTVATPGFATSAAGTAAVSFKMFPPLSSVAVVLSGFPFHCTTVWVTKPRPFTVSTKSALPALIWAGERKASEAPVLF